MKGFGGQVGLPGAKHGCPRGIRKRRLILQARLAGPGMDTMKASAKRQPNRGLWSSILEAFGGQVGPPGTKNGGGFSEKTAKHRPLELDFGGFWRPSWASRRANNGSPSSMRRRRRRPILQAPNTWLSTRPAPLQSSGPPIQQASARTRPDAIRRRTTEILAGPH